MPNATLNDVEILVTVLNVHSTYVTSGPKSKSARLGVCSLSATIRFTKGILETYVVEVPSGQYTKSDIIKLLDAD